jgi:hypothetical protein
MLIYPIILRVHQGHGPFPKEGRAKPQKTAGDRASKAKSGNGSSRG